PPKENAHPPIHFCIVSSQRCQRTPRKSIPVHLTSNFWTLPLQSPPMLRTQLYAEPTGRFVHDVVLQSCRQNGSKTALIDTSCNRRVTFADYGSLVESLARGLISAGLTPGEVVAIFLPNSWEFAITYHAATLAGGIPTLLNPSYREREVRYQLENSGAAFLSTDAPLLENVNLAALPCLRRVFTTRILNKQSQNAVCEH